MESEYLTMAEIEKRYPNEWVLIDRPKLDETADIRGGIVKWHHADRREFDRRLPDYPLADSAIFYSGFTHPEPILAISTWTDDSIPG